MREMVLNHLSVNAPDSNLIEVLQWLDDLVRGMSQLIKSGVSARCIRTAKYVNKIQCLGDLSLYDVCLEMLRQRRSEEFLLFMRLVGKYPLLHDLESHIDDRFRGCGARDLPESDQQPLILCAIANFIAVGLPSKPVWSSDKLTVRFDELLPDDAGTIICVSEEIDQLTRFAHSEPIIERSRRRLLTDANPDELWKQRATIFPHLGFGPEVERNLKSYTASYPTIVGKLMELDTVAGVWSVDGGPVPKWTTKVTRESVSVLSNDTLRRARMFRSSRDTSELFDWHARFGSSGRIHLRLDVANKQVEIGYIGPHLPLK